MKGKIFFGFIIVSFCLISPFCTFSAMTLSPGIYAAEDLTADPEPVTLVSVGTDDFDEDTFRQETEETFNLEVYELEPGLYRFVNDPAAKTDQAALNADVSQLSLSDVIADSDADGVLIRGLGNYPGETAITFGLINEYPEVPRTADGEVDYDEAAVEIGYKFYTGRRNFGVDGIIGAFENIALGDHANNNIGVIHTFGGGRTFMTDVWIYNVYDGIFFDGASEAYMFNCILHQTYQPWNTMEEANADGYFTEDWEALVQPPRMGGELYADAMGFSVDEYPQLAGVTMGNDVASGWNINLIETEGADPQMVYMRNCTLIRHQIRDSNRLWRHNEGGGAGAFVLIEDSMILSVDISPHVQIRIDADDPDIFGSMFNTKFWNYASESTQLTGISALNWNIDPGDQFLLDDANVDLDTPGGLDIPAASELFRLDGRKLTTFMDGAIELTMATDGGQIGYRLPDTAPDGSLPVTTGEPVGVSDWSIY